MKTRAITRLAKNLRSQHVLTQSWNIAAKACGVLTPDGRPNPRLAQLIAENGYDPRRTETRQRLGLPPVCPCCDRRIKTPRRQPPAWLAEAVRNLETLTAANPRPAGYTRTGQAVEVETGALADVLFSQALTRKDGD